MCRSCVVLMLFVTVCGTVAAQDKPALPKAEEVGEAVIFDFQAPDAEKVWSQALPPRVKDEQPPVKVERTSEGALKLTFDGGRWPAVQTKTLSGPADWSAFKTIKADITVDRPAVVGFHIVQEKGKEPDAPPHDWTKTSNVLPGTNAVDFPLVDRWYGVLPQYGKVVSFQIMAYEPAKGQSIVIDNIHLSAEKVPLGMTDPWSPGGPYNQDGFSMACKREWERTGKLTTFRVAGTDWTVRSIFELGAKVKDQWKPAEPKTLEQVEADFRALYDDLKKTHPDAVMAVLREGDKGYDPARPDAVYAGWIDTHISSHDPDGPCDGRERNLGAHESVEAFMRHRSYLAKADLSSIPAGSEILAARLVLIRPLGRDLKPPSKPHVWVVEPCNRPWTEDANGYEYTPGKMWKAVNGLYYGEDPDFLPIFLAFGPSQGEVNAWDLTEAVRFWTDGKHPNHGFFLHNDAQDYMMVDTSEAKDLRKRPAVMVIYVPKK